MRVISHHCFLLIYLQLCFTSLLIYEELLASTLRLAAAVAQRSCSQH